MTRTEAKKIQSLKTALRRMKLQPKTKKKKNKSKRTRKTRHVRDGGYLAFTHTRNASFPTTFSSSESFNGAPYRLRGQNSLSIPAGGGMAIRLSTAWLMCNQNVVLFDNGEPTPLSSAVEGTCRVYNYTSTSTRLQGTGATATVNDLYFAGQVLTSSVGGSRPTEPSIKSTFNGLKLKLEQHVANLYKGFKVTICRMHNGGSLASYDDVNNLVEVPSVEAIKNTGLPHTVTTAVNDGTISMHYLPMSCTNPVYRNKLHNSLDAITPANNTNQYGHMIAAAEGGQIVPGYSNDGTPNAFDLMIIIEPYDTTVTNNFTMTLEASYFSRAFGISAAGGLYWQPHKATIGVSPADPTIASKQSVVRARTAQKHAEGEPTGIDKAEDIAEGGAAMVGGGTILKNVTGASADGTSSVVTGIEEVVEGAGGEALGMLESAAPLLLMSGL